ncbi:MAG: acetolactate synthase small subunit [Planctomycetes bacterium]|nr:acetolactate synthase small subunit [Planctomycetota bacterium]
MTTAAAPAIIATPVHTISLLVRNKPGVLVRIALVFSRRGYNIDSLVVSPAFDAEIAGYKSSVGEFSRMTITCSGDPENLEQIVKQLEKLIDVVHALDHTNQSVIQCEIALMKIKVSLKERTEILQIAETYKAKVVDYGHDSLILRCAGEGDKLDALIALAKPFGIIELVRSGKVLMVRGLETT